MTHCHATQQSDQMYCPTCQLTWDVNDPEPPECRQVQPQATMAMVDEIRRSRGLKLRNALEQRDRAERMRVEAERMRKEADKLYSESTLAIKSVVEVGERFVFNDTLVTVTQHGGVNIERVTVVSLL